MLCLVFGVAGCEGESGVLRSGIDAGYSSTSARREKVPEEASKRARRMVWYTALRRMALLTGQRDRGVVVLTIRYKKDFT